MKKVFVLVTLVAVLFVSCADEKTINGTTYRPYGLLNESTCKNDSIQYEISMAAVITSVLFCEVIIPPIYSVGFNLWQPIGLKRDINQELHGVVR